MFKKFLKYVLFSLLSFLLFLLFVVILAAVTMGPDVKENSVLVLNLQGSILEQGPETIKERLIFGEVLTTRGIVNALKKAKEDNRIKALLVTAFYADLGFGKAQEIRTAIQDFAKSKKPVYGYLDEGDTLEYYLCSTAPKMYMPPDGGGGLYLLGLRAEIPFYKGTLDKLGVVAQMDHTHAYKSYSDQYTRESMSREDRQATNLLLDSLYSQLVSDLAENRKLPDERMRHLIDQGPFLLKDAKEKGLVNDLLYRDQLDELIKKEVKLKEMNTVSVLEYQKPTFAEVVDQKKHKIAIVYAVGSIAPGESSKGFREDTLGSGTISDAIRQAREEESVKAIILRVDSPGGSPSASDMIWREVQITKSKKPVVVSMADVAASGGYYISMGASKILAEPTTITGSIGVVVGKFHLKGLYDKIGMTKEILKRGEHADLFSDYVPFDEERWEIIHRQMFAIYEAFTKKAAEGRKKTLEQIDAVAQGRVWTGEQAVELGLVDQLGGLEDAIREAKKLAKLEKEDFSYVVYPAPEGAFSDILSARELELDIPDQFTQLLTWARIAQKEHVLLLMPYRFEWE